MRITSFLVCEFANSEATGKVNLIGAGVDRVFAGSLPAVVDLYLYVHCISDLDDEPGFKKGKITLVGDTGKHWEHSIQLLFTEDHPASAHILKVHFRFTTLGHFRLECTVEGSQAVVTWPIEVRPRSLPPSSPN